MEERIAPERSYLLSCRPYPTVISRNAPFCTYLTNVIKLSVTYELFHSCDPSTGSAHVRGAYQRVVRRRKNNPSNTREPTQTANAKGSRR